MESQDPVGWGRDVLDSDCGGVAPELITFPKPWYPPMIHKMLLETNELMQNQLAISKYSNVNIIKPS